MHHWKNQTFHVDPQFASTVKMHSCKVLCAAVLASLALVVSGTPLILKTSPMRESAAVLKNQQVSHLGITFRLFSIFLEWDINFLASRTELSRVLRSVSDFFHSFWSCLTTQMIWVYSCNKTDSVQLLQ